AYPLNHFARTPPIASNVDNDGANFVEFRRIPFQEYFGRFGIAMDSADGLVQFVRQRRRHLADGCNPTQMSEFIALLEQLEFGKFSGRNIDTYSHHPHRPIFTVESRMPPGADPPRTGIGHG